MKTKDKNERLVLALKKNLKKRKLLKKKIKKKINNVNSVRQMDKKNVPRK